ncbi:MAG: hypothetical protein GEU90_14045 [Gemmatimonas sp.]|nr:hypothetical protein [Gemmatimonas sp.]
MTKPTALIALLVLPACGPRIAELVPVTENGQVLQDRTEAEIGLERSEVEAERARLAEERALDGTAALASCTPALCDAVARGELAIGMNESQVLAATGTTSDAWAFRDSGGITVMTARLGTAVSPGDAISEIAYISLQNGSVSAYTYREPQGFRTVTSPEDGTLDATANARAEALLRQGDGYAAGGQLDLALDRYDRADVLRPNHPETTLRIASTLDKTLRPLEASIQYQLFIHQMELELIGARGEAAARIAEAIALARERIVVIEQR